MKLMRNIAPGLSLLLLVLVLLIPLSGCGDDDDPVQPPEDPPVEPGTPEDLLAGILTAYEVAGLDLDQTRLVVLSACDTGTGLHRRGQEIQGLRWGFRAAGAQSLVTSLWRSNDAVTRKLMRSFYSELIKRKHSEDVFRGAAALRQAQLVRIEAGKRLVWVGRESRLAWWVAHLAPSVYERMMLRRAIT